MNQFQKYFQEYKEEIKRLRIERDLYRQRAIDELMERRSFYHTRETATLDVDQEVMRLLGEEK